MERHDRIREAVEASGKKKKEIAKECGVSPPSISQWITGETKNIKPDNLFALSRATGYSAEWLATGRGEKLIRVDEAHRASSSSPTTEAAIRQLAETNRRFIGLTATPSSKQSSHTEQHGQYDNPSEASPISTNIAPGPRIKGRVPLISWVQAGNWTEAIDVFQPEDAEDWVISAFNHSDTAFALRVKGISMEPEFREGEIIIVDPARCADPGKFVVAKKTGTNEATFKKLIQEGGEYYLKAINPDWPEPIIRMDEEWQISGVVIGKTKAY